MRRLLKFLLHWSPSMHVPHFFDWHTYVKRPSLQWPPSHKSLWHLSIGAAAGSAILVLLLLWSGIHGQPTAIKSPEATLASELDLGPGQEDDPFASAGPKSRVADEGPDPFAMTLAGNPDETSPLSGNEPSDEMFATAKPVAARTNDSTDAFDSEFAPPIEVSQKATTSGPTIGDSFGDEPAIVMEAKSNESPAEPDDNLEPFAPEAEPKIALEAVPAETPAEPEPEPIAEPKIVMEAPDETTAEPEPELEPIAAQPEPKIALDEKPHELPAEPDDAPAPPAKTLEVALAPMPELGKSEPIDEEPPAAPYKVVQVAQANRPHPFGEDDDEPMRKPAPAPKPIAKPQAPPRSSPMDDEAFDDTPPKKSANPSPPANRPRPSFSDDDDDPMGKPPATAKAPGPVPKPLDIPPAQPAMSNSPSKSPMSNNPMGGDDEDFPMNKPAAPAAAPAAKQNTNWKLRDMDDEQPAAAPKIATPKPKAAPLGNRPNPFGEDDPMGQPRPVNAASAPSKPVVQTQEFPDPAQPPMPQPPQNAPMPQQQKPRPSSQVYDESVTPQDAQMKPKPELRLEILSAPEAVEGGPVVLSFRIANVGRIPATGVLAIDVLPPELRHPSSQRLEYRIGRLNPGESRSTQLRLTAGQTGLAINRASVSSDEGAFAEGSVRVNILPRGSRPNSQPSNPPGNCEPVPYQYILVPQPDCCVPY